MKKNIAYLFLFLFISSPTYSQNWVQEGETIVGNDSDLLGEDVEISGDGNTIAVGARLNDANNLALLKFIGEQVMESGHNWDKLSAV